MYSGLSITDEKMTVCHMKEVMETNLIMPMILTRKIWPLFRDLGGGVIININSMAGKEGGSNESVYCASKHGLAGFSKALQFDATRDNIRVINVYLGAMDTPMSNGRKDQEKFMDPVEVASIIESLVIDPGTLRINEITLTRQVY
jgi:short-subunit dehydrogenase